LKAIHEDAVNRVVYRGNQQQYEFIEYLGEKIKGNP
jgi:hypothetical protein